MTDRSTGMSCITGQLTGCATESGDGTPQLLIPRDQSLNSPPHAYVEQLVAIEDSLKRIFTD